MCQKYEQKNYGLHQFLSIEVPALLENSAWVPRPCISDTIFQFLKPIVKPSIVEKGRPLSDIKNSARTFVSSAVRKELIRCPSP